MRSDCALRFDPCFSFGPRLACRNLCQVETPADVLARERFGKYRGLKSMRTSPWDPMESLPRDYAKVYAFDNFARSVC